MKKVIAMVVCVAMFACFALTASAATKVTFNVSTVENAKVGDVVFVDISTVEKQTKIGTLAVKITYDTEKLKFVMNEDEGKYFVTGEGAGGATAAGNEESMEVQMATADGFWKAGKVLTLAFEVIADIDDIAVVNMELLDQPTHCEDDSVEYDVTINAGGVKGVAKGDDNQGGNEGGNEGTKDPVDDNKTPVEDNKTPVVDETVTDSDATNPATGDATGIAVAAGLAAVMAAAFVITKKVND